MGTIEEVKRELRKVLGLNPLDRLMDSSTMFKIQSEKSKAIIVPTIYIVRKFRFLIQTGYSGKENSA